MNDNSSADSPFELIQKWHKARSPIALRVFDQDKRSVFEEFGTITEASETAICFRSDPMDSLGQDVRLDLVGATLTLATRFSIAVILPRLLVGSQAKMGGL